jgi:NADPH:quinone reductase-like Zn-dependent oxidoreductase
MASFCTTQPPHPQPFSGPSVPVCAEGARWRAIERTRSAQTGTLGEKGEEKGAEERERRNSVEGMADMRAMVIDETGSPEVLRLARVPVPTKVTSEVLVRVHAAGINPIDAKTRAGKGAASEIRQWPAILGHDFSGVIVEAPYEAYPLQPGDEVFGMVPVPRYQGSHAEYLVASTLNVAPKPSGLSHLEAGAVPLAALTARGVIVDVAQAAAGQRILIHAGSGGVGHFAVQLAALAGAEVIATASARNADWLLELGASRVIDYSSTRFEDELSDLDTVIDLVGNVHDDTGTRSLSVLRPGGLIVNVPTGSWPTFIPDATAAGMRATHFKLAPDGVALAELGTLLDSGALRVHIDQVFDLERAAEAHRALEEGHTRGKIVLRVAD